MKPKRKASPSETPVAIIAPVDQAAATEREKWYRSIMTDSHGDFDTGRLLVNVVIVTMCVIALFHGDKFDAQNFGIGIGSVLTGFAAYLFGDAQRPPPAPPSTTTTVQQTQVTTP